MNCAVSFRILDKEICCDCERSALIGWASNHCVNPTVRPVTVLARQGPRPAAPPVTHPVIRQGTVKDEYV
jgi:hypothetical protein